MRLRLTLLFLLSSLWLSVHAQTSTDSLLSKLNAVLADKDVFVKQKQVQIENLNKQITKTNNTKAKFNLYQQLFNEYKNFSYDSAYYYARQLKQAAIQLNDPPLIAYANMAVGYTFISSGMFKETLETLNGINVNLLSNGDKVDYYFLKARSYFDLADFDRSVDYSAIYNPKGIKCIDSALEICQAGTYNFLALKGLKDLRTGNFADGVKDYTELLNLKNLTPHQFAVTASNL